MAKKTVLDEDSDMDFDVDEYGGVRPSYESIIKKCRCGFKGELITELNGYSCADCGYLLIDNSRQ